VSLAEERLPLREIAKGPADELGFGPEFQAHSALCCRTSAAFRARAGH
jgi:hypothetical protein